MDISYFHSRPVLSVEQGGPANAAWTIKLESGGEIYCLDESHEAPVLDGTALMTSEKMPGVVRVYFGTDMNPHGTVINFREGEYALSDTHLGSGEVIYPDQPVGDPVPEDDEAWHAERTQEGPSQAWHDEQARIAAETEATEEPVDE